MICGSPIRTVLSGLIQYDRVMLELNLFMESPFIVFLGE